MPLKKRKPEEILGELRKAEIVLAQGVSARAMCRQLPAPPLPQQFRRHRAGDVLAKIDYAQAGGGAGGLSACLLLAASGAIST